MPTQMAYDAGLSDIRSDFGSSARVSTGDVGMELLRRSF
jgi:hypothetical protein